jgi:rare lipoprotein A
MTAAALKVGAMRRWAADAAALTLAGVTLAACAGGPHPAMGPGEGGQPTSRYTGYKVGKPYQVHGIWYYPKDQPNYDEIGIASWYGDQFHNHYTADGEVFDMNMPSAAHKTLPLPSLVEVTNLANGRKVLVRVNDRGPFVDGRVIDMSKAGAAALGFVAQGVTRVRVRYIGQAPDPPGVIGPHPPMSEPRQEVAAVARRGAATRSASPPIDIDPTAQSQAQPQAQAQSGASAPAASPAAASVAAVASLAPSAPRLSLPDVDRLLSDSAPATYELQAGTFATEDAARGFAANLTGGGLPEVQPVEQGGQTVYRVIVRGLADRSAAAAARSEAIALGAPRAQILGGS